MDPALILLAGLAVILLLQFSRVSRQRREVRETQSALAVGRRVLTAAGMIGTVAQVGDDTLVLVSEDGTRTTWVKASVVRVLADEEADGTSGPQSTPGSSPDHP